MLSVYTEDQIFDAALNYFRLSFPTQDLSDRGLFGLFARAFARFASLAQYQLLQVDNDAVPAYQQDADGNVRSRCSSAALDAWAFVFGLPSGVPGIYGRRGATISTGGTTTPSGTAGTVVPAGTQAADSTGQVLVQTTAAITLDGPPNTQSVGVISVTAGAAANLPVGSLLTWVSPPAGLAATATFSTALVGALDRESDVDLLARLLRRIQNPPRGGTANDYRTWAELSTDVTTGAQLGINRAYIYPLRNGLGSVDVVPFQNGSGAGRIPGAATLAKLLAYLETQRPVTAKVRVVSALAIALRLRVRIVPSTAKGGVYGFDWNDQGVATAVSAHDATAKTISCAAPARLKAAVDSGRKPRIQLINSAPLADVVPFQARVLSYVAGTPDVLTLDSFPSSGPIDAVDYFWAGGGAVDAVAARLLAYVDQAGPSRQSGFADPYDAWESDVTLARITDVVMETKDEDGTRMVVDIPRLASNGVTLAVGSGGFAATSFTPRDGGANLEYATLRKGGGIEVVQAQP